MKTELHECIEAVSSLLYRSQDNRKMGYYRLMTYQLRSASTLLGTLLSEIHALIKEDGVKDGNELV